jgi:UDPglucose 6-dehydrogenase
MVVEATVAANRRQREWALHKIVGAVEPITGSLIAVAGLAFKPNTDDMRDAPSVDILKGLLALGAKVRAYDPAAMENARSVVPGIEMAGDVYSLADGADCLVFMTEWNSFRKLNLRDLKSRLKRPLIVDLRNIYEADQMREIGFEYYAVGRRSVGRPRTA